MRISTTVIVAIVALSAWCLAARASAQSTLPDNFFYKPPAETPKSPAPSPKEGGHAKKSGEPNALSNQKGRFSRDGQGVITDRKTGLQWYLGPNQDMSCSQSERWVSDLAVAGGGWRLPTMEELRGIYGTGIYVDPGKRYSYRIDPAFQLNGCCPWSSESRNGRTVSYLLFNGGGESTASRDSVTSGSRALAVRTKR